MLKQTSFPCPCGVHHSFAQAQAEILARFIDELGAAMRVTARGRTWLVPRVYIAAHGLKEDALPNLGFEEVTGR